MNVRSTYLHLLSDALSSVAVVLGALFMWVFKIYWLDPLLTILIALYIVTKSINAVYTYAHFLIPC
jgi:cobalt-zinc-cadmium efflux system protein